MVEYQQVRMDLMSSKQVQHYLRKNDMVVLPVGCFEMHGPDVPLGCDSFHAWAQAILLADAWECLCLPPVYYTFPGASGPWPGTVDISNRITMEYITEIVLALLKGGFKRVILCGTHGPLGQMLGCVIRDVYQSTRNVVVHVKPPTMPEDLMMKELGYKRGEDILLLASLKLLGLHGAYDPATKIEKRQEFPFQTIAALRKHRVSMPWTFAKDYQHTGLRKKVKLTDADTGIKVMKQGVERMKDFPKYFAKYQKEMKDLITQQPWKKATVWTKTK
jgi:creatinine amidohydrolase/Fe(II)-dependent formamide hydrolase-like protein